MITNEEGILGYYYEKTLFALRFYKSIGLKYVIL